MCVCVCVCVQVWKGKLDSAKADGAPLRIQEAADMVRKHTYTHTRARTHTHRVVTCLSILSPYCSVGYMYTPQQDRRYTHMHTAPDYQPISVV